MNNGGFCKNCGHSLPAGAKFCGNCGTPVSTQQMESFCSICGAPLEPGAQFCSSCGTKVQYAPQHEKSSTQLASVTTRKGTGALITSWKLASLYKGEPTVGVAQATGTFSVYDDRLEFKKILGNSLGGTFGLVGMAVAKKKANEDPLLIYPLGQITQLRLGKYGGVYNTLVVVMRDGTKVSICPATPGSSAPQAVIDSLKAYL